MVQWFVSNGLKSHTGRVSFHFPLIYSQQGHTERIDFHLAGAKPSMLIGIAAALAGSLHILLKRCSEGSHDLHRFVLGGSNTLGHITRIYLQPVVEMIVIVAVETTDLLPNNTLIIKLNTCSGDIHTAYALEGLKAGSRRLQVDSYFWIRGIWIDLQALSQKVCTCLRLRIPILWARPKRRS